MSYNFISYPKVDSAHLAVEVDGTFYAAVDAYTDAYSQVVPSTGTPGGDYSVFKQVPVRGTSDGYWSISFKDPFPYLLAFDVKVFTPDFTTGPFETKYLIPVVTAGTGVWTIAWTFCVAGTPTDLPVGARMLISATYAYTKA